MAKRQKALRRNGVCACELLEPRLFLSTTMFREGGGTGYTATTFDDTTLTGTSDTIPAGWVVRVQNGTGANNMVGLLAVKDLFTLLPQTIDGGNINISSAKLHVFCYTGTTNDTISIDRLTSNWLTGTAGNNEGDTTFLHRDKSADLHWASGSDFSSSDYSTTNEATGVWVNGYQVENVFDITALVRDIYSTSTNYGFAIRTSNASVQDMFYGSETGTVTVRPAIEITYTYDATVSIVATDASAAEPSDTGTYTITRAGSTGNDLTVNYTVSGTATNGTDYTALSGTVTIPSGQATATITLTPTNDNTVESTETAILTLASGTGYTIGSPSGATVNIADNDSTLTISATDASAAEPSDTGTFTVTRSGYTGAALTVNYNVTGTATNGTDYTTLSGTVTIPSGQTTATITVTPIDDSTTESTETVILTLASGTDYTVGGPNAATVNIADNDNNHTLTVNAGSGDGTYSSGAQIGVAADTAPQGYIFDRWTGDTVGLASVTVASTTYTMPSTNAAIFATYIPSSGVVLSTVTGTATTGSTLTISGVNFGTKATAAPVKYDNFDSGTNGNNLSGWSAIGTPKYSNTVSHNGTLAGMSDFTTASSCAALQGNLNLTTVYLSYWVYIDHISGVVSRNIKLARFTAGLNGDQVHGNPEYGYTQVGGTGTWYTTPDTTTGTTIWGSTVGEGGWHRVEMYGKISTINTANGGRGLWLDGTAIISLDNSYASYTSGSNGAYFNNVVMPFFVAHDDSAGNPVTTSYKIYYDDVYIDNTLSRVEIGDAPTWSACTQRVVQPASSWSSGSIQVTANLGSFTDNTVYVYVVDANNNVNATGYEITIGQTSSANCAPAVDAGANQSILASGSATLNGTAADDGMPSSPGSMSYTWSKVAGIGNVTFANASAIDTTATFSAVGEYKLKLSVTDGNQTREDFIMVLAKDANNRIPVVNLGDSAANNVFGFVGWNTLYLNSAAIYSSSGPDGVKGGSTGKYHVAAVSGVTHTYAVGDKVVSTWYNDSASSITFTPQVSFDDPDLNGAGTSGTWYNMSAVTIAAYGTATSSYTIDATTAGTHSLLNVCRGNNNVPAALLDKVELELT